MASNQLDEKTHKIFFSDPKNFKSMVNKIVEVETVHGAILKGILYTVDPVSETVMLLNPMENSLKLELITGFNVKDIKTVQDLNVPKIPDNIFKEDWAKYISEEDLEKKRLKLKEWLLKNTIPIKEDGKVLKLDDILSIEPPYGLEQCMSSNEMVLSKIQNLLKTMPAD